MADGEGAGRQRRGGYTALAQDSGGSHGGASANLDAHHHTRGVSDPLAVVLAHRLANAQRCSVSNCYSLAYGECDANRTDCEPRSQSFCNVDRSPGGYSDPYSSP